MPFTARRRSKCTAPNGHKRTGGGHVARVEGDDSSKDALGNNTEVVNAARLVTPKKRKNDTLLVDANVFFTHKNDATQAVCYSTASTNKCRARDVIMEAMEKVGDEKRQAAALCAACSFD